MYERIGKGEVEKGDYYDGQMAFWIVRVDLLRLAGRKHNNKFNLHAY